MTSNCNEAVDLEKGENALDDDSHRGVRLVIYLAVETHCHIVQNISVAAENEEALIEWLIINTCMDGQLSTTLRLTR